jgi:hypothetical protein
MKRLGICLLSVFATAFALRWAFLPSHVHSAKQGTIRPAITFAKPVSNTAKSVVDLKINSKKVTIASADLPPITSYLAGFVGENEAIAVGQITSLNGQSYYLRNQNTPTFPGQRVYNFTVTQVLKGPLTVNQAIKVVCFHGATVNGSTDRLNGVAWLAVGQRYILFLKKVQNYNDLQGGYVQETLDGLTGKSMELDEWILFHPTCGPVKLSGGSALPNSDATYTNDVEQFADFPLFNVPETTAIANIQAAITASW